MPCREGQQRDVASLLDGAGETALVRGANTGQTPRHNLAALGDKLLQEPDVAVWNGVDLLSTELAHLLAAEKLSAASGTTRAGAALAARAVWPWAIVARALARSG